MTLKLVTFESDLTQFLVEVDPNLCTWKEDIIKEVIEANKSIGEIDDEMKVDIEDVTNYTVEDVDFKMLHRFITMGMIGNVIIFND